jgi:hypothetical protein
MPSYVADTIRRHLPSFDIPYDRDLLAQGQLDIAGAGGQIHHQIIDIRAEWAAQASLQHAERLMVEAKSKNYPLAAEWLKRVKKAYALLGKTGEWQAYYIASKSNTSGGRPCRPSCNA